MSYYSPYTSMINEVSYHELTPFVPPPAPIQDSFHDVSYASAVQNESFTGVSTVATDFSASRDYSDEPSFMSQDSAGDSFLAPFSPNQSANTSTISSKSTARKRALRTTEQMGLPATCKRCGKLIEFRNRSRHSAFHSNIFRFKCSACDYKAHLSQNVKTHLRVCKEGAELIENKSIELANQYTKMYAECFGEKKAKHSLEIFSGRKGLDEASYLDDSGITIGSFDSTLSSQSSQGSEELEKTYESIGEQTFSARTIESILKRASRTYKCTQCKRFVGKAKIPAHVATHSSRKRFRCSECGVLHHSKNNLRTHIKLKHMDVGEPLDEMDDALHAEYKALEKKCFPDAIMSTGKRGGRKKKNPANESVIDEEDENQDQSIMETSTETQEDSSFDRSEAKTIQIPAQEGQESGEPSKTSAKAGTPVNGGQVLKQEVTDQQQQDPSRAEANKENESGSDSENFVQKTGPRKSRRSLKSINYEDLDWGSADESN